MTNVSQRVAPVEFAAAFTTPDVDHVDRTPSPHAEPGDTVTARSPAPPADAFNPDPTTA